MMDSPGSRSCGRWWGATAAPTARWCSSASVPEPGMLFWWKCAGSSSAGFRPAQTWPVPIGDINASTAAMVRPGQLPFVASMAEVLSRRRSPGAGATARNQGCGRKNLGVCAGLRLGPGCSPPGCQLRPCTGSEWRALGRPVRGCSRTQAPLRDMLKNVYLRQSKWFAELSISLVDIHEILRLHGQVCCTRTPDCGLPGERLPVAPGAAWDGRKLIRCVARILG